MVYRLVAFALIGWTCYGQQSNTVYAQLVTNSQLPSVQINLDPKYNIGQPFHIATVTFSDAPGKTCNAVQPNPNNGAPLLDILGGVTVSADLNYITNFSRAINPNNSSPTNRYRMISSAAGPFPLLAVAFSNYDNVNCRFSLFYSGTLAGIDIKKYTTFGGASDQLRTFPFNVTATDNLIVAGFPNGRASIYGLVLYNATAQSITINDAANDSTLRPIMILTSYCAGCQLVLPNTNFPLFISSMGGGVSLHLSAATPVSGYVMVRYE